MATSDFMHKVIGYLEKATDDIPVDFSVAFKRLGPKSVIVVDVFDDNGIPDRDILVAVMRDIPAEWVEVKNNSGLINYVEVVLA
jgi:hypothetical protein